MSDVGLIGILEVTPAQETLSPTVDIPSSVLMLLYPAPPCKLQAGSSAGG